MQCNIDLGVIWFLDCISRRINGDSGGVHLKSLCLYPNLTVIRFVITIVLHFIGCFVSYSNLILSFCLQHLYDSKSKLYNKLHSENSSFHCSLQYICTCLI